MLSGAPIQSETPYPQTPQPASSAPLPVHKNAISQKTQQILIYLYSAISILLTFRFVLSMIGARQETPFVNFVYQLTVPFMIPFANMFGRALEAGRYRLEFEVLVALLVYAVVFYGIAKLVSIIFD